LHDSWPAAPATTSLIAMDAPPPQEDCRPFVHVAHLLAQAGVHAPRVLASDLARGFLLLTDLGTTTYAEALDALVRWQLASRADQLPPYDEALLRRELALFPDWYVTRHLGRTLSAAQRASLDAMFDAIITRNLAEPRVFV